MPFLISGLRPVAVALACVIAVSGQALALEEKPFDAAAFKSGQDAGKPSVIHVTAPWCPTCKAQHQALDALKQNPEFSDVTVYTVDFDSQTDVWKGFKARSQSTVIGFAGPNETGRLVGVTKTAEIEKLVLGTTAK